VAQVRWRDLAVDGDSRRIPCRDGREFLLRPQRAAVLVIDMQRDFCQDGGYGSSQDVAATQRFASLAPSIAAVIESARQHDLHIIYTREGHHPDLHDITPAKLRRSIEYGSPYGAEGPMGRVLIRGEYGHDIIDSLRPEAGDPVVDKPGYGAFYATSLRQLLQDRMIEDLIFTGVTTDVCLFSTLREAVDRGYRCLTLEDCTAAFNPTMRDATMTMIESEGGIFGWVGDSDLTLQALAELT